jgi:glycosyltransferase involved in cell wall biosynthesis
MADASAPSRVIYLSSLPPPAGGIATWTRILLERGLPDGFTPVLVDTRAAAGDSVFARSLFSLRQARRTARILGGLVRALRAGPAVAVHVNMAPLAVGVLRDLACVRIARRWGVPAVVHHHGLTPAVREAPNARLLNPALRRIVGEAAVNVVMNEPSREYVQELLDGRSVPVVNVPNFYDERSFPAPDPRPRAPERRRRVAFVAGLTRIKGTLRVVEVARRLPEVDFHLYGQIYDEVREALDGAPDNAHVHGEVSHDEVIRGLQEADLFLFPTVHPEGFPYGVLEAMALGLPVVSTHVGAIPEMVEEGCGGLLTDPTADALADAVARCLADDARRAEMGRYNHEKAERLYTYPAVAKRLAHIYADLREAAR